MTGSPFTALARRKRTQPVGLEPVPIIITRDHAYSKGSRGCKVCHGAKYAQQHIGHSESVNQILRKHWGIWDAMMKGWTEALLLGLSVSGLPQDCRRIFVEGVMVFPQKYANGPDQGNHRFIVEKALGDALQKGGYLDDDAWWKYEFGGLGYELVPGLSQTRLLLFPS